MKYLKTQEVADMIGINKRTLYRFLKRIGMEARRGENNYMYFTAEEVEEIKEIYYGKKEI